MLKTAIAIMLLFFVGCAQNKTVKEQDKARKYTWIKQENSKYSFTYPSDWVVTQNAGPLDEAIHINSKASAAIDFSFMILPDTIPGDQYIDHMVSSITPPRSKLTKHVLIKKKNKTYTDILYEQEDYAGVWKHEHILYTDGQKTYSLQFTSLQNKTPKQITADGDKILQSFEVK